MSVTRTGAAVKRALAILALALTTATGCSGILREAVIYPSITPDETVTTDQTVSIDFSFEDQPVQLTVAVDGALYAGATAADKQVIRFGNARENDWLEDYFPAFVNQEAQDGFYQDLLAAFRTVRDARALDSDRYAELLTAYVQSLTYLSDPVDLSPKFPVETAVEKAGDCDDKTLLLAGLLSREGYDVAIFMFEPEQHVALGLRAADMGYRDTGYAFVETTTAGYVGQVPDTLAGGITLTSVPRVFGIDGGTTAYTAGAQVAGILEARNRAISEASGLAADISRLDGEISSLETRLSQAQAQLDSLKASGRIAEYNARIPAYNDLVAEYNARVEDRNAAAERHNALAEIDRAVVEGASDRVGTYAAVTSMQ